MLAPTLSLTLATSQVLHVHMSEPAERVTYENLAKHQQQLDTDAAELAKTYHLGAQITVGRAYDDRLSTRLGLCRTTILGELNLWREFGGKRGGLRHICVGKKYLVSEQAVREFVGDLRAAA